MPVVRIFTERFCKIVGADRKRILDRLPYIGLDIESVEEDSIRVEYSPNRPDFGTDFGIARALRGLLGKETGLPRFRSSPSGISVTVDPRLASVRPFIACVTAKGLTLDDEDVRQLISLQEDLHNGLGRKRKAVAIGLHDMDAIEPPLRYSAVDASFSFSPLGRKEPATIKEILTHTDEGVRYGPALGGSTLYPVITDSKGIVLSFPPIINGNATKVTPKTENIFVDVTSTDEKAGDDVLAIIATTIAEAGGRLGTVSIKRPRGVKVTPDLAPSEIPLDVILIRSVLGLDLTDKEIAECLYRARLGLRKKSVLGPRYRLDLMHPVDVAEEVALGFGVDRITPIYPASKRPGAFDQFEEFLDSASTLLAGMGMIEQLTYELTDARSLYTAFQRPDTNKIGVKDPRSVEHSLLRDSLIPTLMSTLTGNIRAEYPQRIFEIGRVFQKTNGGVSESFHLGCLIAHSQASYTEAKMYLESFCRVMGELEVNTKEGSHWAFASGRCAAVAIEDSDLGRVGELKPEALAAYGVGVPVSGFEVELSHIYERLK